MSRNSLLIPPPPFYVHYFSFIQSIHLYIHSSINICEVPLHFPYSLWRVIQLMVWKDVPPPLLSRRCTHERSVSFFCNCLFVTVFLGSSYVQLDGWWGKGQKNPTPHCRCISLNTNLFSLCGFSPLLSDLQAERLNKHCLPAWEASPLTTTPGILLILGGKNPFLIKIKKESSSGFTFEAQVWEG